MTELAMTAGPGRIMPPPMTVFPHPLTMGGKSTCDAPFLPRETLGRYVERNGINVPRQSFAIWHNGQRVMPTLWDRLIPRDGDHIILRSTVQGGGGGNKVLSTALMIAVAIAAVYTGGLAAGLYEAGSLAAATAGGLASAAVMIGGSLMISPLIPEIKQ